MSDQIEAWNISILPGQDFVYEALAKVDTAHRYKIYFWDFSFSLQFEPPDRASGMPD